METEKQIFDEKCLKSIMAVHDAMDILNGRWKITIIALLCHNKMRFTELLNTVKGISGKMLSRELKDLEINKLVSRTVLDTQPVSVQYKLTDYGETLKNVIDALEIWGLDHRKKIIGKDN